MKIRLLDTPFNRVVVGILRQLGVKVKTFQSIPFCGVLFRREELEEILDTDDWMRQLQARTGKSEEEILSEIRNIYAQYKEFNV